MADEVVEKKERTPATPEQIAARKASKLIAFNTWRQQWRAANPEGTKEQRREAWAQVRKAETKAARRTMKALEKGGFAVVPTPAAEA